MTVSVDTSLSYLTSEIVLSTLPANFTPFSFALEKYYILYPPTSGEMFRNFCGRNYTAPDNYNVRVTLNNNITQMKTLCTCCSKRVD